MVPSGQALAWIPAAGGRPWAQLIRGARQPPRLALQAAAEAARWSRPALPWPRSGAERCTAA